MKPVLAQSADLYTQAAHESASRVIRSYSTSFALACRILPRQMRRDIASVYALVRVADEIVDGAAEGAGLARLQAGERLDVLEADVLRALGEGFSQNLVVHAFADVARRTGFAAELVTPFFTSMRTDLTRQDHDEDSFATYVYGSAEVVGLMCLHVFVQGPPNHDAETLVHGARRLGAAFQKVNFLRDLEADAGTLSRSYFPGLDVRHVGVGDVHRLVAEIDADLDSARATITLLPRGARPAVQATHDLFRSLNRRIRANAASLRGKRIRVPNTVKLLLLLRARLRHLR